MPESRGKDNISEIKTALGQYFLQERIAQGGMAEIYKGIASDIHGIKRTVVIKKILPNIAANKEYIDMLVSEAKIAVQLSHGNIAQIYDLGKTGNDYFMVMEFVNGKSLSQIHKRCLKEGQLIPLEYILYFISEVANGLDYMHNKSDAAGNPLGIVHRDISPQNIIISYSGTVKIIDFGIAKAAFKIDASETGVLKGKFAYMSPEQARGDEIDGRSDIFSLGVILHELSCGRRLFKDKDNKQTIRNVRKTSVEPPSAYNPELPPELDKIVMTALAKEPSKRYQRAGKMRNELIKLLYLKFPNFKSASISKFIEDLFGENFSLLEEEKETEHTPLLIIDQTQAAIDASAPDVMKEFMLDSAQEEELEKAIEEKEKEEEQGKDERFQSFQPFQLFHDLATRLKEFELLKQLKPLQRLKPYLPFIGIGSFVVAILLIGWASGLFSAWSEFISPTVVVKQVPLPEPVKYARVEVDSDPRGAYIFIDDRNTGLKTPIIITNIIGDMKFHTIGIYAEGYKFWTSPFSARPNEPLRFAPKLNVATGSMEILSEPNNASVIINGATLGQTPLNRQDIPPNTVLTVKVEKEGFVPWEGSLKILQDKVSIVRVNLLSTSKKPQAPPRPAETEAAATEALPSPEGETKTPTEATAKLREALTQEPEESSAQIELKPLPPDTHLMPAEPAFPKTAQPAEEASPKVETTEEQPEQPEASNVQPETPEVKPETSNLKPETKKVKPARPKPREAARPSPQPKIELEVLPDREPLMEQILKPSDSPEIDSRKQQLELDYK